MDDYRIWVTYHKDEQVGKYGLHDDDTHRIFAAHHNADGQNINALNPVYSEMVTMWYVWKNNLKSSYVGFNHYRRRFNVGRMPEKGECQVYSIRNFGNQTVYEQYAQWHNAKDLDVALGILNKKYGESNGYVRHIRESHMFISNNCFLMKWADFTKLCKFLFPILEEFAEKCGCKTVDDWRNKALMDFGNNRTEYQKRCISFIAERLVSAWIMTNLNPFIGGRNVAIVNYNTTKLTDAAIRSLMKNTPGCQVYVFDNSDKVAFKTSLPNVKVIDNTKGQLIDFEAELEKYPDKWNSDKEKSNYGSMKHTMSVDKLMELIPEGFVLMDSDVLVTQDISMYWDNRFSCVGSERIKRNVPQLQPFLCYLNVPVLRQNNIRYYNGDKMWALSNKDPNQNYETGAWLLEEVRRHNLPVNYVNIWGYIIHYGHGSWRGQDAETWLKTNRNLYE